MNNKKKNQLEKRDERLTIALSKEERDMIEKRAEYYGISMSAYLRQAVLEYGRKKFGN